LPIGPSNFALGLEGFFFAPSRPLLADAAERSSPPEGTFRLPRWLRSPWRRQALREASPVSGSCAFLEESEH